VVRFEKPLPFVVRYRIMNGGTKRFTSTRTTLMLAPQAATPFARVSAPTVDNGSILQTDPPLDNGGHFFRARE
jgi:hypothetical protein